MAKFFFFRNRIREVRTAKKLSREELGKILDTTEAAIESFESGAYIPSARMALSMCMALDCSFEDLFFADFPAEPPKEVTVQKIF